MGKTLEKEYEQLIVNYPNILNPQLRRMRLGNLGETNVFLRQTVLGACRIDVAFVTAETIHLVELKRDLVDENTLDQWRSYYSEINTHYPRHLVIGYLVGARCHNPEIVTLAARPAQVRVMRYGVEIPHWSHIRGCDRCGFGLVYDSICPDCTGAAE